MCFEAIIGGELCSADAKQKMMDEQEEKIQLQRFKTDSGDAVSNTSVGAQSVEAETVSDEISTEEAELTLTDIFMNANKTAELPDDSNPKHTLNREVAFCSPNPVERGQPRPLCDLLPSSTITEVSHSFTSISRSQDSLKTTTARAEDGEDLCAAILLACLFCHPLDCLVATARGCNECVWSLCYSLCGCKSTTPMPFVDMTQSCDVCSCLGDRCLFCDCPVCDICLQATECLDLAMEISQMLYH